MFALAATGLGVPLFVTARSHSTESGVTAVVLLLAEFGSLVVAETEELAVMEAAVTVAGTLTTTMMSAAEPAVKLVALQVIVPVAPTAGVVHVHPEGAMTDSNVVLVGVASVKTTADEVAGPLFVMVCVYVMLLPEKTLDGLAAVLRARSASVATATMSVAVAEFAPNDWFAALTVAVSVIVVPLVTVALTL